VQSLPPNSLKESYDINFPQIHSLSLEALKSIKFPETLHAGRIRTHDLYAHSLRPSSQGELRVFYCYVFQRGIEDSVCH
jgi:hypothetical protein